jgi:hypothetical protein
MISIAIELLTEYPYRQMKLPDGKMRLNKEIPGSFGKGIFGIVLIINLYG